MAMVHPDDLGFSNLEPVPHASIRTLFIAELGLTPLRIVSPSTSQGEYHKVYFVALETKGDSKWSGREVVLRVARSAGPRSKDKVRNEVGAIHLVREAGVPAPEVIFWFDTPHNALGYEYIAMDKIPGRSVSELWPTMTLSAKERVLDQLVEISLRLFRLRLPGAPLYGSINLLPDGTYITGPVLEEWMWQLPDIERYFTSAPYNLSSESNSTLNPAGPFPDWPSYISAFLKTYAHIIDVHPSVPHLRPLLPPLRLLISDLDAPLPDTKSWIQTLRDSSSLVPHLWHGDRHLANLLGNEDGTILAVIDWEFSAFRASFYRKSSPLRNLIAALPDDPTLQSWPPLFLSKLTAKDPDAAKEWEAVTDLEKVLGREGLALSNVREFVRSCVEVGVRGWGRTESGRREWLKVVRKSLEELGYLTP